jgi:hypothetical protein
MYFEEDTFMGTGVIFCGGQREWAGKVGRNRYAVFHQLVLQGIFLLSSMERE